MKMKFSALIILILTLLFLSCNCDDILGKDDDPDYPVPDHGNTVIEETQDDIENGGTLTLSSGHSATYYGDVGATILQEISIGDRDVIDNEFIFWSESESSRDSMIVEGPVPSGINSDSLYAIWYDPATGNSGVSDNSGGTDRYEFAIPGDASFYEVRWPWSPPSSARSMVDRTIYDVPYYEQYTTDHCWACVTSMMLHFYSNLDPQYEPKMWSIVASTNHYDGYNSLSMRYYSTFSDLIYNQIWTRPQIEIENFPNSLGELLKSSICDSQYIVGLKVSHHMVLVNGWETDGFYCHDPHGNPGDIYKYKNWDVYVTDQPRRAVGYFDNVHLVVTIPKAISTTHPGPTLSIGNPDMDPYGIHLDPDTSSRTLGTRMDMARLAIDDITNNSGGTHGYHWVARGTGVLPRPTIKSDWNLHAIVRVYNPSLSAQNYLLTAILQDKSGNNLYTSPSVSVSVPRKQFLEVIVDTIPLNIIAAADTHNLIVNLYDASGTTHHDRLKIHVPIDERATPAINHCEMHYGVWGYYSGGSDYYTSMIADCDVSYNSSTGLYTGSWSLTDNVGSITFTVTDANSAVDSFYLQATDHRGTHEMVSVNIPYASSSPLGPGPRYYLEGAEVCGHTAQLDVDWSDAGWGVMTSFDCVASGFYMSHMDIVFSP